MGGAGSGEGMGGSTVFVARMQRSEIRDLTGGPGLRCASSGLRTDVWAPQRMAGTANSHSPKRRNPAILPEIALNASFP